MFPAPPTAHSRFAVPSGEINNIYSRENPAISPNPLKHTTSHIVQLVPSHNICQINHFTSKDNFIVPWVYINRTKSRKIGAENFKVCCRYHTLLINFFVDL